MIIILYVMDSLRSDFLSCYGYPKETSPHIDQLAREGVLFKNAFAQSTWTRPSGASLLTSTYPSVNGVLTVEDLLPAAIPTLPEQLKKHGFKTIAITSMGNVSPIYGFGRGFDQYIELYREERVIEKRKKIRVKSIGKDQYFGVKTEHVPIATSEDINEFLFPLIEENRENHLFFFIWSLDTHHPYFHRDMEL